VPLTALAYLEQVHFAAWSVKLADQTFGPKPA